jgi:hypothetical protein
VPTIKNTDKLNDVQKEIKQIREEARKKFEMNSQYFTNGTGTSIGNFPWYNNYTTVSPISNITINDHTDPTVTKINTPLLVNDRDILKELDEMRDALLLLKRDVNMEEKHPRLKELKDQYEQALEKYKTFEAIKDSK